MIVEEDTAQPGQPNALRTVATARVGPHALEVFKLGPREVDGVSIEVLGLTQRQSEVMMLLAQGKPNKSICRDLRLSEGTVKVHVGRILAKLDLRDRVQAVVLAYESGIITPGS